MNSKSNQEIISDTNSIPPITHINNQNNPTIPKNWLYLFSKTTAIRNQYIIEILKTSPWNIKYHIKWFYGLSSIQQIELLSIFAHLPNFQIENYKYYTYRLKIKKDTSAIIRNLPISSSNWT